MNKQHKEIFNQNKEAGFWDDRLGVPKKMQQSGLFSEREIEAVRKAFRSQQLMLIVSEVAEAMEGDRKSLKDDKLPQYDMVDVELVDAQIRIKDWMGSNPSVDYDQIEKEKLEFNKNRLDHKRENRYKVGGKAF